MGQWRGHMTKQTNFLLFVVKESFALLVGLLADYLEKSNDERFLLEKSQSTPLI